MGVTLQWDKGTTVVVRVDPEHKGSVEGNIVATVQLYLNNFNFLTLYYYRIQLGLIFRK